MLGWLSKVKSWWRPFSRSYVPAPKGGGTKYEGQASNGNGPFPPHAPRPSPLPRLPSGRLERIVLSDAVAGTLFDGYAEHRRSERGEEETGWILLGLRHDSEAIALAALPAGTLRDAGRAHIRFNSHAQELACRILRQNDKRLQMLGVVHTHPGSLRYPSEGDLQGDILWVGQQRGGEGIFGIGTADAHLHVQDSAAGNHMQIQGAMCFSWYALGIGDRRYRPIPVHITIGPDLASPLRPLWNVIEANAEALNRLSRQFAKVHLEVEEQEPRERGSSLCVKIALAEANQQIRLLLSEGEARYYWEREGEFIAIDPHEPRLCRAIYLILAELAKEPDIGACAASEMGQTLLFASASGGQECQPQPMEW